MQALFDRVRQQASRAAWSEGVELARAGAVQGERESAGEVVLRVRPRAGVLHPSLGIMLRPEWSALLMSLSSIIVASNAVLLKQVERQLA